VIKSTALLAAVLVTIQASDSHIERFGTLAITDAEVAQIARVSESTGKRPLLILGFSSMVPSAVAIGVYLEPDIVNAEVHRNVASESPRRANLGSRCAPR
jgi:hypothetical protein